MRKLLLSAAVAALTSSAVMAGGDIAPVEPAIAVPPVAENYDHEGFYAGIAYSYMSHDIDYAGSTTKTEMDFHGVMLEAGYQFNKYIAAEIRYAATIGDDIDSLASSSEASSLGLFVRPMLPLSERATVYGLLGYGMTKTDNTLNGTGVDFDENGLSWGGGFSMDFDEDFTGFVEYVRWYDDSVKNFDHVVDGFGLGVMYKF